MTTRQQRRMGVRARRMQDMAPKVWGDHLSADEKRTYIMAATQRGETKFDKFDLSGVDLRGINLSKAKLKGANLSRTKISQANGADFSGARLVKTDLAGAQLAGANFQQSLMLGANFSTANMKDAQLQKCVNFFTNFSGITAPNVDFTNAISVASSFANGDMNGAHFNGGLQVLGNFTQSNMERAEMQNMRADYTAFDDMNAKSAKISLSLNSQGSTFHGAVLEEAELGKHTANMAQDSTVDMSKAIVLEEKVFAEVANKYAALKVMQDATPVPQAPVMTPAMMAARRVRAQLAYA